MDIDMIYVWLFAAILFTVAEMCTFSLVSVWFVAGAVCALLAAALDAQIGIQCVVFLFVSTASLLATRPLARKYAPKKNRTNADRAIGEIAVVTQSIDNLAAQGAVRIDGKEWTARAADGALIPKDAHVRVKAIEGVKLLVTKE